MLKIVPYSEGEIKILVLDWTLLGSGLTMQGPSCTRIRGHPAVSVNMCSAMGRTSTEWDASRVIRTF